MQETSSKKHHAAQSQRSIPIRLFSGQMVNLYLKVKAELENVTDVQPAHTPQNPYEYVFIIECTTCRQVHNKPVSINCYEKHDINGSRGEASFVFRCKNCRSEHSAQITRTKEKLTAETSEKWTRLLEIEARGIDFKKFISEGIWECSGVDSGTMFDDVDLEDGEWHDYDENLKVEVSVVDVEFKIARL